MFDSWEPHDGRACKSMGPRHRGSIPKMASVHNWDISRKWEDFIPFFFTVHTQNKNLEV